MSTVHRSPAPPGTITALFAAHGKPTDWHRGATLAFYTWHLDRESIIVLQYPTHADRITVETLPDAVEALAAIYEAA